MYFSTKPEKIWGLKNNHSLKEIREEIESLKTPVKAGDIGEITLVERFTRCGCEEIHPFLLCYCDEENKIFFLNDFDMFDLAEPYEDDFVKIKKDESCTHVFESIALFKIPVKGVLLWKNIYDFENRTTHEIKKFLITD